MKNLEFFFLRRTTPLTEERHDFPKSAVVDDEVRADVSLQGLFYNRCQKLFEQLRKTVSYLMPQVMNNQFKRPSP